MDKLHLERALDDDSAAEGVTGHRHMAAMGGSQCKAEYFLNTTTAWATRVNQCSGVAVLSGYMHDENKLIKKKYKAGSSYDRDFCADLCVSSTTFDLGNCLSLAF